MLVVLTVLAFNSSGVREVVDRGRRRRPAGGRRPADAVAHRRDVGGRPAPGPAGACHRGGGRLRARPHRAQAVAAPVHLLRHAAGARAGRGSRCTAACPGPAPVRRHDHRPVGRLLAAGPTGRHRRLRRGRRSCTRWSRPGADPHRRQGGGRRRSSRSSRLSQLYLATYHPFDIATGVSIAVAIAVTAFRFFTPNEAFPVTYRRGKTAHLDVGGRRGEALRQAVRVAARPRRCSRSSRSASRARAARRRCGLQIAGDPDTYLFGKLYAMSHVRADRWYKLGRTILYGRLEDEAPFQSVRRFVEYEDYTARLLRDIGIPTADARTASSSSRPSASTCSSPSSSTARRRSATRRGRRRRDRPGAHASSASSGTPASPTATSSRPTCWCATARCC